MRRQIYWVGTNFTKDPWPGIVLPVTTSACFELPEVELLARIMLESLCKSRESTRGQQAVATLPRPHASAPYLPAATDTASPDATK